MVWNTNLGSWLAGGGAKERELRALRSSWAETQRLWQASPIAMAREEDPVGALALQIMRESWDRVPRTPVGTVVGPIGGMVGELLDAEGIGDFTPKWDAIDADVETAAEFRRVVAHRRRYATEFDRVHGIFSRQIGTVLDTLYAALPEVAFDRDSEDGSLFDAPLIELLEDSPELIQQLFTFAYNGEAMHFDLFQELRERCTPLMMVASGLPPETDSVDPNDLVYPVHQTDKSVRELADMYLAGTPLRDVLDTPVPIALRDEVRFEHCHVLGGSGHGKTQLLQRMIYGDLQKAQTERRSIVVIDSQGDLINRLSRLALFDPDHSDSLADRLVLIDPTDVEFPPALNLFDAHLGRLGEYRPADRERVLNGVVETYEGFFGDLLGAELTQKQGVVFRYLARLMLTIPDATLHTLLQLLESPKAYLPYMRGLEGSARYFFETEFFEPAFAQTKRQIVRRLWGVLSTPAFERMFAQPNNKVDLFGALQDGKIILVNTAKDLLKSEGSAILGRFVIGLLAQAALERSTVAPTGRTPTMVYVDEAQEYFDDRVETILTQARKYRVGLTLAHQSLDQLSPRLRAALHTNTSIKCVGGASAKDARAVAEDLHTSADFITGMRRRADRTEFAAWIRNETPRAIRVEVPLGYLEGQPLASEEGYAAVRDANRRRYCGTYAEVEALLRSLHARPDPPTQEPSRPNETVKEPVAREPPVPVREMPKREPAPRVAPAPKPEPPKAGGKGGSQHTYLQHLIKRLAEERGFRAVVEEAVADGQVDVGLHRGDLSIACEISVSSKSAYEAQNLAKCLRAGFTKVWAIAADTWKVRAIQRAAEERLGAEVAGKIEFLTTEDVIARLEDIARPEPEPTVVRGYTVRTRRKDVAAGDALERRRAIARILAKTTAAERA